MPKKLYALWSKGGTLGASYRLFFNGREVGHFYPFDDIDLDTFLEEVGSTKQAYQAMTEERYEANK